MLPVSLTRQLLSHSHLPDSLIDALASNRNREPAVRSSSRRPPFTGILTTNLLGALLSYAFFGLEGITAV